MYSLGCFLNECFTFLVTRQPSCYNPLLANLDTFHSGSAKLSPPWSAGDKNPFIYLTFQESPRKGRTNSTTCIIRNQPGLRENTPTMTNRVSGTPRPSLSFMPRQPRGKNAVRIKAKRLKTRLNWNFQANRRCWDLSFSAESHGVRSVWFIWFLWSKNRLIALIRFNL